MTTSPSHEQEGPPPQAVERLKREAAEAIAERDQARQGLASALLVDTVYGHLTSRKYGETEWRPTDNYGAAKFIAAQIPLTSKDPAAEVDRWLTQASSLLRPPTVAAAPPAPGTPATQVVPSPAPGGGSGPNPGAAGLDVNAGPFPVGGKEFKDFVAKHGMDAVGPALTQGLFFFSDENKAAQDTARQF